MLIRSLLCLKILCVCKKKGGRGDWPVKEHDLTNNVGEVPHGKPLHILYHAVVNEFSGGKVCGYIKRYIHHSHTITG